MTPYDRHRNQFGHTGGIRRVLFDFLQRLGTQRIFRILRFVERSNSRVDVPAVIIELDRAVCDDPANVVESFPLDVFEAYYNIRNLDAGVIDIVLNFDFVSRGLEYLDKRVANRRISKMADVRGLVWIDIGVLDDDLLVIHGVSE